MHQRQYAAKSTELKFAYYSVMHESFHGCITQRKTNEYTGKAQLRQTIEQYKVTESDGHITRKPIAVWRKTLY